MDGSVGEALVRATLEEAFPGLAFVKTRREPWLQRLEIDCYNAKLWLGAEYQGKQHYEYVPYFHSNGPEDFEAQQLRDALKRERAFGVQATILEIPYTVPHRAIRGHVRFELVDLGYVIAPAIVPLHEFFAVALEDGRLVARMLEKACAIAESHGGICCSTVYVDCHEPLMFTCSLGHEFEAALASVNSADHMRPRFCPECGGTRRRTLEENKELVKPSGYKLLNICVVRVGSDERSLVEFSLRCPAGHMFQSLRSNFLPVINGNPRRGCMKCARRRANQEKSKRERRARAILFGLVPSNPDAPFVPRNEPEGWKCVTAGHCFEASWVALLSREGGRKCLKCVA